METTMSAPASSLLQNARWEGGNGPPAPPPAAAGRHRAEPRVAWLQVQALQLAHPRPALGYGAPQGVAVEHPAEVGSLLAGELQPAGDQDICKRSSPQKAAATCRAHAVPHAVLPAAPPAGRPSTHSVRRLGEPLAHAAGRPPVSWAWLIFRVSSWGQPVDQSGRAVANGLPPSVSVLRALNAWLQPAGSGPRSWFSCSASDCNVALTQAGGSVPAWVVGRPRWASCENAGFEVPFVAARPALPAAAVSSTGPALFLCCSRSAQKRSPAWLALAPTPPDSMLLYRARLVKLRSPAMEDGSGPESWLEAAGRQAHTSLWRLCDGMHGGHCSLPHPPSIHASCRVHECQAR